MKYTRRSEIVGPLLRAADDVGANIIKLMHGYLYINQPGDRKHLRLDGVDNTSN